MLGVERCWLYNRGSKTKRSGCAKISINCYGDSLGSLLLAGEEGLAFAYLFRETLVIISCTSLSMGSQLVMSKLKCCDLTRYHVPVACSCYRSVLF